MITVGKLDVVGMKQGDDVKEDAMDQLFVIRNFIVGRIFQTGDADEMTGHKICKQSQTASLENISSSIRSARREGRTLTSYQKTLAIRKLLVEKKVETLLFRLFSSTWRNNGFHFLMRKLRTSTDCMIPETKLIG